MWVREYRCEVICSAMMTAEIVARAEILGQIYNNRRTEKDRPRPPIYSSLQCLFLPKASLDRSPRDLPLLTMHMALPISSHWPPSQHRQLGRAGAAQFICPGLLDPCAFMMLQMLEKQYVPRGLAEADSKSHLLTQTLAPSPSGRIPKKKIRRCGRGVFYW